MNQLPHKWQRAVLRLKIKLGLSISIGHQTGKQIFYPLKLF